MDQPHENQSRDLEVVVLKVHPYGKPPVDVKVPADATGRYAAMLVSQRIGINPGKWPGLQLVTNTGEKILSEDNIARWNGQYVRLGITYSSLLTGK